MPPFALPAIKNKPKMGRKIHRLGRIGEMNTSGNGQPQESRGEGAPTRTWSNAEPRDWWIAPSESQIWHCSGAAAAALREGSTTSPCPTAGRRATNSRLLAPRPHLPAPHWPPLLSQLPPTLVQSFLVSVLRVRALGQGWWASSRGEGWVREGLREAG